MWGLNREHFTGKTNHAVSPEVLVKQSILQQYFDSPTTLEATEALAELFNDISGQLDRPCTRLPGAEFYRPYGSLPFDFPMPTMVYGSPADHGQETMGAFVHVTRASRTPLVVEDDTVVDLGETLRVCDMFIRFDAALIIRTAL